VVINQGSVSNMGRCFFAAKKSKWGKTKVEGKEMCGIIAIGNS